MPRTRLASRYWQWVIMALAAVISLPVHALSLDDLIARLALADGRFESPYTQTRESTLLSEPVRTRGRIVYEAPGRLRKTERGPGGERLIVIRDDTVEIHGPEETRRFPVSRARPLQQLMRLLDALASGDAQALQHHFAVELRGDATDWTLVLEAPTEDRRRGGMRSVNDDALRIRVDGQEGRIGRIALEPPRNPTTILDLGSGP